MPTYITKDAQGHITASADTDAWQCSEESKQRTIANLLEQGYALSLKPVVRGYDGGLYFEGEAPVKPAAEVAAEQAATIRNERDRRIADCDYLMMPDYPIAAAGKAQWTAYRQALRDLPAQPGFPWGGVISSAPWPVAPA